MGSHLIDSVYSGLLTRRRSWKSLRTGSGLSLALLNLIVGIGVAHNVAAVFLQMPSVVPFRHPRKQCLVIKVRSCQTSFRGHTTVLKASRQKQLAMTLSKLPPHPAHNAKLEQYATDGDVAARWLASIDAEEPFADLDCVADLGAGNGILGIGALLLGAPRACFVEVDSQACDSIRAGLDTHDLTYRSEVYCIDIHEAKAVVNQCDMVLMNPPWGQQRRSADRPFLESAIGIALQSVHVLHSSGAVHIEPWASDAGWEAKRWMEAKIPLPKRYAHQKQRRAFTDAAMWCLSKRPPCE